MNKIVVPIKPTIANFGTSKKAISGSYWFELKDNEGWEDYFIFQQNNYSGVAWTQEELKEKIRRDIQVEIFDIISNSGNGSYKVRRRGESWYCQCKGFYFRKHCSHIDEAKRLSEIQLEKLTN